jgi:tRNA A37 N6-isopentenylltransferase MiaA
MSEEEMIEETSEEFVEEAIASIEIPSVDLDGLASEAYVDEAIDLIKQHSRNYAKRQYTWFNNQFDVKWFEVDLLNIDSTIQNIIEYLR